MSRLKGVVVALVIGGFIAGGAVWVGSELADTVNTEHAAATAAPPPPAAATPIGEDLDKSEEATLGQVLASLGNPPGIRVHQAVWVDKDMRTARLPVIVTNTDPTPRQIRARLRVFASPDGYEVNLYDGVIDSGEPIGPGKSLVKDVTVGSVRAIGPRDLRIELRPITDQM